ncbi:uncharacterized mitochondrial protein AtMg01250-like [Rutidosis leptorrhynchoides]|uniref:uncharacterized mitochondrial protein AtMg01250-like n=1 Tax=Rutidosis leptorrhynchoides TaxID=125765 RepID=UPI003A99A795
MGFGSKWKKWLLSCLTSASVLVLINGSPTKEFSLGRGVRQGYPLSPFLFILAAEGLNILTKSAFEKGYFKGVEVGKNKIDITHLQYADYTMFFGSWSKINVKILMKILKCFELASGLRVNFQKSTVYGVGVSNDEVQAIAGHFKCQKETFHSCTSGSQSVQA